MMLWPCFCAAAVEIVPGMRRFGERGERLYDMFALIGFITQLLQSAFLMTEDVIVSVPFLRGTEFRFHGFGGVMCMVLSAVCVLMVQVIRDYSRLAPSLRGRVYSFMLLSLSVATCAFTAVDFRTLVILTALLIPFTFPIIRAAYGEKSRAPGAVYIAVSAAAAVMLYTGIAIIGKQIGAVTFSTVYTFSSLVNPSAMSAAMLCILCGVCLYSCGPFVLSMVTHRGQSCLHFAGGIFPLVLGLYTMTMTATGLRTSECAVTVIIIGSAVMCVSAVCALIFMELKRVSACICLSVCGETIFSCGAYMLTGSRGSLAAVILSVICGCIVALLSYEVTSCAEGSAVSTSIKQLRGAGKGKPVLVFALLSLCLGFSSIPSWNGYVIISLLCDSLKENGNEAFIVVAIAYSALCLAVGLYTAITICVQPPTEYGKDIELHPSALLPAVILPVFGIMPSLFTEKVVNFVLAAFRAGSMNGIRLLNGELLTGAFISLIIGVLIYALARKR